MIRLNSSDTPNKLTTEEIEVRIWGFVVIAITLILIGIVFALLYSVTFVTQPIKSMAPIDQAYTKMLNDIVLLLVGGIGGIVGKRAVNSAFRPPQPPMMQQCGNGYGGGGYGGGGYGSSYAPHQSFAPSQSAYGLPSQPFGAMPVWKNPELDESWTPGPPPTTPPEHLEDDEDREEIAQARKEVD